MIACRTTGWTAVLLGALVLSAVACQAIPCSAGPRDAAIAQALRTPDPFMSLVPEADAVVVASLTSKRSYWSPDHRLILTLYQLSVGGNLHGSAPATLSVEAEGGEVGEVGLEVSDAVRFWPNEQYVLLLERAAGGPHILGDALGVRRLAPAGPDRSLLLSSIRTRLAQSQPRGGAR
jgi:hypothetical protein